MSTANKSRVGLKSPRVLMPALICLVVSAVFMVWGATSLRSSVPRPSVVHTYSDFASLVAQRQVASVEMYRDSLHVQGKDGQLYFVQDVSPEYTIALLLKNRIPLTGLPQPGIGGSLVTISAMLAILLPYGVLVWIVIAMLGAVSGAAEVDPESYVSTTICMRCQKIITVDDKYCSHCGTRQVEEKAKPEAASLGNRVS